MRTHKAYTFAILTSSDTNQSLQKSMLLPTLRKNKKSLLLKKNKTLLTHNPIDRKRKIKTVDKQKGMSLDKKEGQLVTRYIKNWTDTAEIKGCILLQALYQFDSELLQSAQLFIYRNR